MSCLPELETRQSKVVWQVLGRCPESLYVDRFKIPFLVLLLSSQSRQGRQVEWAACMSFLLQSMLHTLSLLQFSNLHQHQMVEDLVCFYSPSEQKLQYVIQLGRYSNFRSKMAA